MTQAAQRQAPNLKFSHMGLSVRDIGRMEDFCARIVKGMAPFVAPQTG